ncbi:MAG: putative quinol monooxygenase [Pseudomonadota bacterium]
MSYCVSVRIEVSAPQVEAFREAIIENATRSVEETTCSRFDVWSDPAEPTVFYLYEVYHDESGHAAHLETAHFARFDAAVSDMVLSRRLETFSTSIVLG